VRKGIIERLFLFFLRTQ